MRNRHEAVPRPPCQIAIGRLLRRLWPYLRPYKMQGLLILAAMLLDLLFDTALRLSFKWLIDAAIVPRNATLLGTMLLGLAGGLVVAAGSALGRDYLYAHLGTSVLNDLRLAVFTHQ